MVLCAFSANTKQKDRNLAWISVPKMVIKFSFPKRWSEPIALTGFLAVFEDHGFPWAGVAN